MAKNPSSGPDTWPRKSGWSAPSRSPSTRSSLGAEKRNGGGWRDLVTTRRASTADAWDFLVGTPLAQTPQNYPLKNELGLVTRNGQSFTRWQHKPALSGDARIWFYVVDQKVYLERVHTHHPDETKR